MDHGPYFPQILLAETNVSLCSLDKLMKISFHPLRRATSDLRLRYDHDVLKAQAPLLQQAHQKGAQNDLAEDLTSAPVERF